MGIPGLFGKFFNNQAKTVIDNKPPREVSSIAFDLNGLLYAGKIRAFQKKLISSDMIARYTKADPEILFSDIYDGIADILIEMLSKFRPQDLIIICIDGPAPQAKLMQQRSRRFKAFDKPVGDSEVLANRLGEIDNLFDPNSITPGTAFMLGLDEYLQSFFPSLLKKFPVKLFYSSHLVPGEGEHKIMDYYRSGQLTAGNHVLYGLDADLIMLSLLAPINNIFLSRENERQVIDIERFKLWLKERYKGISNDDFVVMIYLLGNDFLPRHLSLKDIDKTVLLLLDIYSKIKLTLIKNDEINWSDFRILIAELAKLEDKAIHSLYDDKNLNEIKVLTKSVKTNKFYPALFRKLWYDQALGFKGEPEYVKFINDLINEGFEDQISFAVTDKMITDMCQNYLQMVSWSYLYYKQGLKAINTDACYNYYYAPTLKDLVKTLAGDVIIDGYQAHENMIHYTVLHQLISVLPLRSINILPVELQPLMEHDSPLIDLFPTDFIIDQGGEFVKYKDVGVALIPFVDRERVVAAVEQIVFKPEQAAKYLPAQNEMFIPTASDVLKAQKFKEARLNRGDSSRGGFNSSSRGTSNYRGSSTSARGREQTRSFTKSENQTARTESRARGGKTFVKKEVGTIGGYPVLNTEAKPFIPGQFANVTYTNYPKKQTNQPRSSGQQQTWQTTDEYL